MDTKKTRRGRDHRRGRLGHGWAHRWLRAESLEPRLLLSGPDIAVFDRALELFGGTTVDFGVIPPTQWHGIEKTFTVKNVGTSALTVTIPSTMPTGFSLLSPSPGTYSVQPSQETTFEVRLNGQPEGNPSGSISITTNDVDENPFVLNVTGRVTSNPIAYTVVRMIDDGDLGFVTTAGWSTISSGCQGDAREIGVGPGDKVASWEFRDLPSGLYRLWATWPTGASRPTNATYKVFDGTDSRGDRFVNQTQTPGDLTADGASWRELGDAEIGSGILRISLNNAVDTGMVAADAIRIQRISDSTSINVFVEHGGSDGFSKQGTWTSDNYGYGGGPRYFASGGGGANVARWTFNVSPGYYKVWTTWYPNSGTTLASDAPFTIFDDQTPRATVDVNQRVAPQGLPEYGMTWQPLGGPYQITSLSTHGLVVQLTDAANGRVIADAVRIEHVMPAPLAQGPQIEVWDGLTQLALGSTVSFGTTPPDTPVDKVLTIKNTGNEPLDLLSLSTLPGGFSVTPAFAPSTLPSGGSTSYTVRLQSSEIGNHHGTLSLGSSDSDRSPYNLVLDGEVGTSAETDVDLYMVGKGRLYAQDAAGSPVADPTTPYFFDSQVVESFGGIVNTATVKPPGVSAKTLTRVDGEGRLELEADFATKALLDSSYAKGTYQFTIDTAHGNRTPSLVLPADAYPNAPHVTNWTAAQSVGAAADFLATWDPMTSGTADDFIQLSIADAGGQIVFSTPDAGEPGALDGTQTSLLIPAGTLVANQTYSADLMFVNIIGQNTTAYPGAVGATTYIARTDFNMQTAPTGGQLQFSAATYSVPETAGQATIQVTRTGGSQGEVRVDYATGDGTATAGSDYDATQGTLVLAEGVTQQTFTIPIHDDTDVEGNQTIQLSLANPTNGSALGSQSTAVLTIVDNEAAYGPGTFKDSDGDSYTIRLTGPGTARIGLDGPEGDGGPIDLIFLENTTTATALFVTVAKSPTGDGRVSIGTIESNGSLKQLIADKSDITGSGVAVAGSVGQLTLGNIANGASIVLGGTAASSTKITLGDVNAQEIRSGSTISSLATRSLQCTVLSAAAIGSLSTSAGSLSADEITVAGAVNSISTKGGGAGGIWTAGSFGTINVSGGNFVGDLISTRAAGSLGKTPSVLRFSVSGDFQGTLHALGTISTVSIGGTLSDSVVAAASFGVFTVGRDATNTTIMAGANLGADHALGGIAEDSDTFGRGSFTKISIGGQVSDTMIGAGLDPRGAMFRNGNDAIAGGAASKVGSFTIGGAAETVENYFRAGSWPKSVKIAGASVIPLQDVRFKDIQNFYDVASTDENGNVTLHVAGQEATFQILDDQSGQPIPGLYVGISTGTGTEGLAVLEALDPASQYAPMIIMLHGPEASPRSSSSEVVATAAAAGSNVLFAAESTDSLMLMEAVAMQQLPSTPAQISNKMDATKGVMEATLSLPDLIDQFSGGQLSQAFGRFEYSNITGVWGQDALDQLSSLAEENANYSVVIGGLNERNTGSLLPILTGGMMSGVAGDLKSQVIDDSTTINAPPGALLEGHVGNMQLYFSGEFPVPTPPSETLSVSQEGGTSSPVSRGSLRAFSMDHLGDGEATELDMNGEGSVDVRQGDQRIKYQVGGQPSVSTTTNVSSGGTQKQVTVPAKSDVASLTLHATPGITGPLPTGTRVQFSVVGKYASGQEVLPGDMPAVKYFVFNPFGKQVATIDENTGLLTIGPDGGAIRVVAVCEGTRSNLILSSGLGPASTWPIIVINDITEVVEGDSGTKQVVFDVHLDRKSTKTITVDYNTAYIGSATPVSDYTDVTGQLKFKAGSLTPECKLYVYVKGDVKPEGDEQFAVGLSKPTNARLDLKNSARCTIKDNDRPGVRLAPTSGLVTTESGGTGKFTVKLDTQPESPVTVELAVTAEDALAPSGYQAAASSGPAATLSTASLTFNSINWNTPRIVVATGVNDDAMDGNRPYQIYVSNVTTDDPYYSDPGLSKPPISCINRDNDQLSAGKVYVTVVDPGNGYVIDLQHSNGIDTRVNRKLATYGASAFVQLWAYCYSNDGDDDKAAVDAEWVYPNGHTEHWSGATLSLGNYPHGIALTVTIEPSWMKVNSAAAATPGVTRQSNDTAVVATLLSRAAASWTGNSARTQSALLQNLAWQFAPGKRPVPWATAVDATFA